MSKVVDSVRDEIKDLEDMIENKPVSAAKSKRSEKSKASKKSKPAWATT